MEDRELEQLLRDIESDRVERKESASDGERIYQAICAFANDLPNYQQPGVVFAGRRTTEAAWGCRSQTSCCVSSPTCGRRTSCRCRR